MTMRHLFLVVIFILVSNIISVQSQIPWNDGDSRGDILYELSGQMVGYEKEETPTRFYLKLRIKFQLTNVSKRALVLWRRDEKDRGGSPVFTGKIVSRSNDFASTDIIEEHYGGPSFDYSEKWDLLRKVLDKPCPPKNATTTLVPNESWHFESVVTLIADKIGSDRTRELALDEYIRISPVFMKIGFEIWSPNIDHREDGVDLGMSSKLKNRWSKYGVLLTNDVISTSIKVDIRELESFLEK